MDFASNVTDLINNCRHMDHLLRNKEHVIDILDC